MPIAYLAVQDSNQKYVVYKVGSDGKPTGKPLSEPYPLEAQAKQQISAIELNQKALTQIKNATIPATDQKYWDDYDDFYIYPNKIDKTDDRAQYDPLGGLTSLSSAPDQIKACANCNWFRPGSASCDLIYGPIVATGMSKLWLPIKEYKPAPLEVVIVNPPATSEMGGMEDMKTSESTKQAAPNLLQIARNFVASAFNRNKDTETRYLTPSHSGFKALPGRKWVAYWTNNAEDLQSEVFSEKSHDDFIDRVYSGADPFPDLWWFHCVKYGKSQWLGREGHIVFAAGEFDNTPIGEAFYQYYSTKDYTKEPEGTSHGFLYYPSLFIDNVYHWYKTFEITSLPLKKAANPYTSFMRIEDVQAEMTLTKEKKEELVGIVGPELAAQAIAEAEKRSKELDSMGLKFKETPAPVTTPVTTEDLTARSAVKALTDFVQENATKQAQAITALANAQQLGLTTIQTTVQTAIGAMESQVKSLNDQVTALKSRVDLEFELQPSGTQNMKTIVPPASPMVEAMKAGEGAQAGNKTVFDYVNHAIWGVDPQKDQKEGVIVK